jgi:nucleotide-binding universal stress UspA family protein
MATTPRGGNRSPRSMNATQLTFEHVVVGVDGSTGSVEACRQAARLLEPEGQLELVSVFDGATAVRTGRNADRVRAELVDEAEQAVSSARLAIGDVGRPIVLDGVPARALLRQVTRSGATLAAVGACIHSRVWQALFGGVTRELLQWAPCPVLVARPTQGEGTFPRAIAVGIGDSPETGQALDVARYLEQRFDAPLLTVEPVEALLEAADADLIVLADGSRRARRVAACARSSSLLVR